MSQQRLKFKCPECGNLMMLTPTPAEYKEMEEDDGAEIVCESCEVCTEYDLVDFTAMEEGEELEEEEEEEEKEEADDDEEDDDEDPDK